MLIDSIKAYKILYFFSLLSILTTFPDLIGFKKKSIIPFQLIALVFCMRAHTLKKHIPPYKKYNFFFRKNNTTSPDADPNLQLIFFFVLFFYTKFFSAILIGSQKITFISIRIEKIRAKKHLDNFSSTKICLCFNLFLFLSLS